MREGAIGEFWAEEWHVLTSFLKDHVTKRQEWAKDGSRQIMWEYIPLIKLRMTRIAAAVDSEK